MDKITFTSVELLSFSRKSTGGTASFSASLNEKVRQAMEWTDPPECFKGGNLDGELNAPEIELVPSDQGMKRHAMTLETNRINAFRTVRRELESSRGKGHRTELRFQVHFNDAKGARKLEEYILTCGKSTLSARYTKQPTQENIPGTDPKDDAQGSLE